MINRHRPTGRSCRGRQRPGQASPLAIGFSLIAIVALVIAAYQFGMLGESGAESETAAESSTAQQSGQSSRTPESQKESELETATFGSGCFWCTEAIFERVKGVQKVASGYSGGHVENPTYEQICQKNTGHAEVVQLQFDPQVVSYAELLEIFWKTHDPTTLNRQGNDEGPQYRSAVFFHNEQQRKEAEFYKQKLDEEGVFNAPIVTEITQFSNFYEAEDYHQDYFKLNGRQPYCAYVIQPKVDKLKKVFQNKLKEEYAQ